MRSWHLPLLLAGLIAPAAGADDYVPLEKQFFDYFNGRCVQSMDDQMKQEGKDPTTGKYKVGIESYCGCTAQAVVSWLSAEEILQFANNPEQEPGASKLQPYFIACRDKTRQLVQ